MAEIGVITEQNDLGLGFDPLSDKDQKAYTESLKNQSNQQVINEDENKK